MQPTRFNPISNLALFTATLSLFLAHNTFGHEMSVKDIPVIEESDFHSYNNFDIKEANNDKLNEDQSNEIDEFKKEISKDRQDHKERSRKRRKVKRKSKRLSKKQQQEEMLILENQTNQSEIKDEQLIRSLNRVQIQVAKSTLPPDSFLSRKKLVSDEFQTAEDSVGHNFQTLEFGDSCDATGSKYIQNVLKKYRNYNGQNKESEIMEDLNTYSSKHDNIQFCDYQKFLICRKGIHACKLIKDISIH
jgi:flagellar biosynthesis GTPase FlhF